MTFEALKTIITDNLGPFGPLMVVGLLGVFMILITLPVLLKREVDPLDKLKASSRQTTAKAAKGEKLRAASSKDKLKKYSNFLEPQNAEEYSAVKLKLLQAGYRGKNAVRIYHFLQFSLGIFGLVGGGAFALFKMTQGDIGTQELAMTVMIPGGIGYVLPKY